MVKKTFKAPFMFKKQTRGIKLIKPMIKQQRKKIGISETVKNLTENMKKVTQKLFAKMNKIYLYSFESIINFIWPITKKPLQSRMGKGKAGIFKIIGSAKKGIIIFSLKSKIPNKKVELILILNALKQSNGFKYLEQAFYSIINNIKNIPNFMPNQLNTNDWYDPILHDLMYYVVSNIPNIIAKIMRFLGRVGKYIRLSLEEGRHLRKVKQVNKVLVEYHMHNKSVEPMSLENEPKPRVRLPRTSSLFEYYRKKLFHSILGRGLHVPHAHITYYAFKDFWINFSDAFMKCFSICKTSLINTSITLKNKFINFYTQHNYVVYKGKFIDLYDKFIENYPRYKIELSETYNAYKTELIKYSEIYKEKTINNSKIYQTEIINTYYFCKEIIINNFDIYKENLLKNSRKIFYELITGNYLNSVSNKVLQSLSIRETSLVYMPVRILTISFLLLSLPLSFIIYYQITFWYRQKKETLKLPSVSSITIENINTTLDIKEQSWENFWAKPKTNITIVQIKEFKNFYSYCKNISSMIITKQKSIISLKYNNIIQTVSNYNSSFKKQEKALKNLSKILTYEILQQRKTKKNKKLSRLSFATEQEKFDFSLKNKLNAINKNLLSKKQPYDQIFQEKFKKYYNKILTSNTYLNIKHFWLDLIEKELMHRENILNIKKSLGLKSEDLEYEELKRLYTKQAPIKITLSITYLSFKDYFKKLPTFIYKCCITCKKFILKFIDSVSVFYSNILTLPQKIVTSMYSRYIPLYKEVLDVSHKLYNNVLYPYSILFYNHMISFNNLLYSGKLLIYPYKTLIDYYEAFLIFMKKRIINAVYKLKRIINIVYNIKALKRFINAIYNIWAAVLDEKDDIKEYIMQTMSYGKIRKHLIPIFEKFLNNLKKISTILKYIWNKTLLIIEFILNKTLLIIDVILKKTLLLLKTLSSDGLFMFNVISSDIISLIKLILFHLLFIYELSIKGVFAFIEVLYCTILAIKDQILFECNFIKEILSLEAARLRKTRNKYFLLLTTTLKKYLDHLIAHILKFYSKLKSNYNIFIVILNEKYTKIVLREQENFSRFQKQYETLIQQKLYNIPTIQKIYKKHKILLDTLFNIWREDKDKCYTFYEEHLRNKANNSLISQNYQKVVNIKDKIISSNEIKNNVFDDKFEDTIISIKEQLDYFFLKQEKNIENIELIYKRKFKSYNDIINGWFVLTETQKLQEIQRLQETANKFAIIYDRSNTIYELNYNLIYNYYYNSFYDTCGSRMIEFSDVTFYNIRAFCSLFVAFELEKATTKKIIKELKITTDNDYQEISKQLLAHYKELYHIASNSYFETREKLFVLTAIKYRKAKFIYRHREHLYASMEELYYELNTSNRKLWIRPNTLQMIPPFVQMLKRWEHFILTTKRYNLPPHDPTRMLYEYSGLIYFDEYRNMAFYESWENFLEYPLEYRDAFYSERYKYNGKYTNRGASQLVLLINVSKRYYKTLSVRDVSLWGRRWHIYRRRTGQPFILPYWIIFPMFLEPIRYLDRLDPRELHPEDFKNHLKNFVYNRYNEFEFLDIDSIYFNWSYWKHPLYFAKKIK